MMLKQRIFSALVAAVLLLIVLFALPRTLARLLIVVVMLIAAWEWSGFLGPDGGKTRVAYVGLFSVLLAAIFAALEQGWLNSHVVLLVGLSWWLGALLWILRYPTVVTRFATLAAGLLVMLPAWHALDLLYVAEPALLLFLLVVVWAADIGAYFAGKRYGRVKLAPRVSPGKTWEGVLGGQLLVAGLAVAGAAWFAVPWPGLVPFCMAVALTSIVGDLTVSLFKRNARLKDSGRLFPGHGGLLDRMDSVAAAAPLFALGSGWVGL